MLKSYYAFEIRDKILKKLGYINYNSYLLSPHWKSFKVKFFNSKRIRKMKRKHGHLRCEFCRNPGNLQIHHKTYKRIGQEYCGDVFLICNNCHEQIHIFNANNLWKASHLLRMKIIRKKSKEHFETVIRRLRLAIKK